MNKSLKSVKDLFLKNCRRNSLFTDVAKLANALDLGPSNFGFESSSLSIRIVF